LDREVWIHTAEVYNTTSVPAGSTGFEIGLEDTKGIIAWVDSDDVGGLPRPYDRGEGFGTKTILKILRFPGQCFSNVNGRIRYK
jgi:hypothetical protein